MLAGSSSCQLVPTLRLRLVTSAHSAYSACLPSCSLYTYTIADTAAQALVSLAMASERLAVAHSRSGETLEYLQPMYPVRLDQLASPSFVPLSSQ